MDPGHVLYNNVVLIYFATIKSIVYLLALIEIETYDLGIGGYCVHLLFRNGS